MQPLRVFRAWQSLSSAKDSFAFLIFSSVRILIGLVDAVFLLLLGALASVWTGATLANFSPRLESVVNAVFGDVDAVAFTTLGLIGSISIRVGISIITAWWEFRYFSMSSIKALDEYFSSPELYSFNTLLMMPVEHRLFVLYDSVNAAYRDTPRVSIGIITQLISTVVVLMLLAVSNPFGVFVLFLPIAISVIAVQALVGRKVSYSGQQAVSFEVMHKSLTLSIAENLGSIGLSKKLQDVGGVITSSLSRLAETRTKLSLLGAVGPQVYQLVGILSVLLLGIYMSLSTSGFDAGQLAMLVGGLFRIALYLGPIETGLNALRESEKSLDMLTILSRSSDATPLSDNPELLEINNPEIWQSDQHSLPLNIEFSTELPCAILLRGKSGSGKSSLLRAIAGFAPLTGGAINFSASSLGVITPSISLVTPDSGLLQDSVLNNLRIFSHANSNEITIDVAKKALSQVGLLQELSDGRDGLSTLLVGDDDLSLGQRMRLHLAAAIIQPPDVLLLDEIYSHLDATSARLVDEVLLELSSSTSIILAGHQHGKLVERDHVIISLDKPNKSH